MAPRPLFDAYLVVDWSANNRPKTGRDSIWLGEVRHGRRGLRTLEPQNLPTRAAARQVLQRRIAEALGRGRRLLIGFDLPNAYPKGFARRAGFTGPAWRAVWDGLAGLIEDADDNANNRFAVAEDLNRRLGFAEGPFWGHPPGRDHDALRPTKPAFDASVLAERRLCERYLPGTKPCWQLAYAGSVGSQTLLGIPVQRALRDDPRWADRAAVWPFETGLAAPARGDGADVVIAEIYPSILPVEVPDGGIKDAVQVVETARLLARRDRHGLLAGDFAGPAELSAAERRLIEREEGWILGAGTYRGGPADLRYERRGETIYRRSFAAIRRETRVSHLPAPLRPVAARMVHACGLTDLVQDIAWAGDPVAAAQAALARRAPVICDVKMVAAGLIRRGRAAEAPIVCRIGESATRRRAERNGGTRAAAAIERAAGRLDGSVVLIGNAPTALFRLLELLRDGAAPPAAILAFPVGFVGAAESKQALIVHAGPVPYLTLRGRRGGSAIAAAAFNAIAGARP